jgi:signal transduction histidine kinase
MSDEHDDRELVRLAGLAELGGSIAHEVGNALTAALSLAQVGGARHREAAGIFAAVEGELRRATAIVERYVAALDRRPPQATAHRRLDLGSVARSVGELATHHLALARVQLEIDCDEMIETVGDEGLLRQLVLNLLLNAKDAAGPGGRVRLRAVRGPRPEVRVEDSGRGIPPALRERVFEPGFTTKPARGCGRGLALSRSIARSHGGDIAVGDGALGGAALIVTLPAAG